MAAAPALVAAGVIAWIALRDGDDNAMPAVVQAPSPRAQPPTPPPPPLPVKVKVKVHFTSTPSGAEVRLAGAPEVLGTTPFTIELARAERIATFDFAKPGFDPVREELSLGGDGSVAAALSAKPVEPRAQSPKRPTTPKHPISNPPANTGTPVDPGGTMDVFGDSTRRH
jgi:hypothetical protein